MKKNNKKEADEITKSKESTKKQSPIVKTESNNVIVYPSWTIPEHLNEQDHKDLKRVYELYQEGKFELALNYASGFDTIVREEIPPNIWHAIGGTLTPNGEEELKNIQEDNSNLENIDVKIYTKEEIEQFIIQNHKTLFGDNTNIINNTKSTNEYFPNMFLFDFNDIEKPRLYVIEINLKDASLGLLYARITHFLAFLRNKNYQKDFLIELNNVINANDKTKAELKYWFNEEQDISELLLGMLNNKPAILLIKDNDNVVLDLMQNVYVDTWGKMVRQLLFTKHNDNGDTIFNVNPLFTDIWKSEKQRNVETVIVTENDHLCELPDRIRDIYRTIKSALLETDSTLEFNPKRYYISIRKNKNLAFIQLKRKLVDIVVMNPEIDTKERIKLHKIKTLPDSVKKFWNGECCTVVVENSTNLEEVIDLLKYIVEKTKL